MYTTLQQLAETTQIPIERLAQEHVVQGFLRRLSQTQMASTWVLRGGMITQYWIKPAPRPSEDLDFLSLHAFDVTQCALRLKDIVDYELDDDINFYMHRATIHVIWEETNFPGIRATIPVSIGDQTIAPLQIDVGYGDPISPAATWLDYPCHIGPPVHVLAVRPETLIGWKLHGLFEFDNPRWHAKDLLDLYRYFEHCTLELDTLPLSIFTAFHSRKTPLDKTDRLIYGTFGQSRGSRRQWRRFIIKKPDRLPPEEVQDVIDTVSAALRPHVEAAKQIIT